MRTIKLSQPLISKEAINKVVHVLESGWLTQGPIVAEFENCFKQHVGSSYALAVNSATSGLHIALLSLGVGPSDEVIIPSFTWVATANVVELCGAKPVFADISLETFNITPEQILSKITTKTKAIIIVHLFGKPFDTHALKSKIPHGISIIEDAACAAGAILNETYCGTVGDIGVYSFHPRKSITTGEGGMVVTNNSELYGKMDMLRNHGQDTTYRENSPAFMFDCPQIGFNYRMTDLQAALGLEQFKKISEVIDYRNSLASQYQNNLEKITKIKLPQQGVSEKHSWQSYVVLVDKSLKRKEIMEKLLEFGIETRPGTHAVHTLKYYKERYDIKALDLPLTYEAYQHSIALPLHNLMTINDVHYVSEKIIGLTHAY